jgi:DNA/RNA endonuclease YhcR with UshA esterase domain
MKTICSLVAAIVAAAAGVSAHHSFAAQYDADKPLTLSGSVVRVEWTNPHVHIVLDAKDEKGTVTRWRLEGFPPNMLIRQGWQRDVTLKPGDVVTVSGWRARLEANEGAARYVTFSDGRKMASGPPAGTGGQ